MKVKFISYFSDIQWVESRGTAKYPKSHSISHYKKIIPWPKMSIVPNQIKISQEKKL